MEKALTLVKENPLAYGLYSGLGRLKNLREQQGCPKCETAQMYLGFGLAAFAAYTLWQDYRA